MLLYVEESKTQEGQRIARTSTPTSSRLALSRKSEGTLADRTGVAKDLYDQLVASGATVWFSETEVGLGKSLLREIDRGLAMSRIGIVLATPSLLKSLRSQGVADKELSALLATDRVIPIAHGIDFDGIREVSPLLAARSGLTIGGDLSMREAAEKIAAAAADQSA